MIRIRNLFPFLLLLSVTCSITAQSTSVTDKTDLAIQGRIEGNVYLNDLFDFKLTVPSEGTVLNRAQTEVFRSAGADYIKGDNKELAKKVDNELSKQITLFNYVSKPLGSVDNSSLLIAVIKQSPGATANLILAETLKELSASGKFELAESLKEVKVGGASFVGIVGKMSVNDQSINIRFLVSMRNGYSFFISSNYQSENGASKVNDVVNSIKFRSK